MVITYLHKTIRIRPRGTLGIYEDILYREGSRGFWPIVPYNCGLVAGFSLNYTIQCYSRITGEDLQYSAP